MKFTRYLAIAAAVAVLGIAGCSDDDGASGDTTTTAAGDETTTTLSVEDQAVKDGEITVPEPGESTTAPETTAPEATTPETDAIPPADYITGGEASAEYGSDATFDASADSCFGGDAAACHELYRTSPLESDTGSPTYEGYGGTCGGRVEWQRPSGCATRMA